MYIRPLTYKLDGHNPVPCSLIEYAELINDLNARIVAKDFVEGPNWTAEVSTVFLSLDHGMTMSPVPILFETMVFGGPLANEMERYATWEQAETGHAATVARVKQAAQ